MNIVQASFQASFDARVQRLGETQLADLRTLFRYFDTDGDGAVAADQACRMFALLGLDVNQTQVEQLGEVYLAEFIKIVDSHTTRPPQQTSSQQNVETSEGKSTANTSGVTMNGVEMQGEKLIQGEANGDDRPAVDMSPEAVLERSRPTWELEWKLIDSYRRGHISLEDLRQFIASCGVALPPDDLQRFFECFGDPVVSDNDDDVLVLSKAGFLKFRHEYTAKDLFQPSEGRSESSDGEHEEEVEFRDDNPDEEPNETETDVIIGSRVQTRPTSAGVSSRGQEEGPEHQLAVDPSLFQESEYDSDNDESAHQLAEGASGPIMDLDPLTLDD